MAAKVKIALERLAADGFELELPRPDGRVDRVALARAAALRGGYAQDRNRIALETIAADELRGEARWHWAGGSLSAASTTVLAHPELSAQIALGELRGRARFTGRVAATSAEVPELVLEIGATPVRCGLSLAALVFQQSADAGAELSASSLLARAVAVALPEGALSVAGLSVATLAAGWNDAGVVRATATRLEAHQLMLDLGATRLTFAALTADGVRVQRDGAGALHVEIGALSVQGVELTAGTSVLRIESAHLASGLTWSGRELAAPSVTVDRATVRASIPERAPAPRSSSSAPGHAFTDLRVLDRLEGKIDVDLTVDAKVPFIRRRVATHEFRIPIREGRLDYHRLERDLSLIEDALLDFAIRDGQLVLETNVPLNPFRGHPLVTWALGADELALARQQQLVRLSTLRNYHLPPPTRSRFIAEASTFELVRLDFDNVVIDVRLGGPGELSLGDAGTLRFGTAERAAVGQLLVEGTLQFRPVASTPITELRLSAREALLGLDRLHLGATVIEARELEVAAIESALVQFRGFRPLEATGTLLGVGLRDLRVTLPGAPHAVTG